MDALRGNRVASSLVGATVAALITVPALYVAVQRFMSRRRAQVQFSSSQFVLSAGAVSFQFVDSVPKRVLLVHHIKKNAWLLAKGRKDQGEELAAAAVREVFEETGYRCHLYPVPCLPTRAPVATAVSGVQPDMVRTAENGTEPFAITIRPTGLSQLKIIFWYVGQVDIPPSDQEGVPPVVQRGTHMDAEGFGETGLFEIDEALRMLTYEGDRELVRTAVSILNNTTPQA